ncbi:hypothetical protein BC830DRAFT_1079137 [Chytriomyces sp. MP71]|nr:hypothetical protein BC830DRAFT_1079137 [Chytriomyces sp. MP71]
MHRKPLQLAILVLLLKNAAACNEPTLGGSVVFDSVSGQAVYFGGNTCTVKDGGTDRPAASSYICKQPCNDFKLSSLPEVSEFRSSDLQKREKKSQGGWFPSIPFFHATNQNFKSIDISNVPLPTSYQCCAMHASSRTMHCLGGATANPQNLVYRYLTATDTWISPLIVDASFAQRSGHACSIVGSTLYVFGGLSLQSSKSNAPASPAFLAIDLSNNATNNPSVNAQFSGTLPDSRFGHSLVASPQFDSLILIAGVPSATPNLALTQQQPTYTFSIASNSWSPYNATTTHLPQVAYGASCQAWSSQPAPKGGIFCYGGALVSGGPNPHLTFLNLSSQAWTDLSTPPGVNPLGTFGATLSIINGGTALVVKTGGVLMGTFASVYVTANFTGVCSEADLNDGSGSFYGIPPYGPGTSVVPGCEAGAAANTCPGGSSVIPGCANGTTSPLCPVGTGGVSGGGGGAVTTAGGNGASGGGGAGGSGTAGGSGAGGGIANIPIVPSGWTPLPPSGFPIVNATTQPSLAGNGTAVVNPAGAGGNGGNVGNGGNSGNGGNGGGGVAHNQDGGGLGSLQPWQIALAVLIPLLLLLLCCLALCCCLRHRRRKNEKPQPAGAYSAVPTSIPMSGGVLTPDGINEEPSPYFSSLAPGEYAAVPPKRPYNSEFIEYEEYTALQNRPQKRFEDVGIVNTNIVNNVELAPPIHHQYNPVPVIAAVAATAGAAAIVSDKKHKKPLAAGSYTASVTKLPESRIPTVTTPPPQFMVPPKPFNFSSAPLQVNKPPKPPAKQSVAEAIAEALLIGGAVGVGTGAIENLMRKFVECLQECVLILRIEAETKPQPPSGPPPMKYTSIATSYAEPSGRPPVNVTSVPTPATESSASSFIPVPVVSSGASSGPTYSSLPVLPSPQATSSNTVTTTTLTSSSSGLIPIVVGGAALIAAGAVAVEAGSNQQHPKPTVYTDQAVEKKVKTNPQPTASIDFMDRVESVDSRGSTSAITTAPVVVAVAPITAEVPKKKKIITVEKISHAPSASGASSTVSTTVVPGPTAVGFHTVATSYSASALSSPSSTAMVTDATLVAGTVAAAGTAAAAATKKGGQKFKATMRVNKEDAAQGEVVSALQRFGSTTSSSQRQSSESLADAPPTVPRERHVERVRRFLLACKETEGGRFDVRTFETLSCITSQDFEITRMFEHLLKFGQSNGVQAYVDSAVIAESLRVAGFEAGTVSAAKQLELVNVLVGPSFGKNKVFNELKNCLVEVGNIPLFVGALYPLCREPDMRASQIEIIIDRFYGKVAALSPTARFTVAPFQKRAKLAIPKFAFTQILRNVSESPVPYTKAAFRLDLNNAGLAGVDSILTFHEYLIELCGSVADSVGVLALFGRCVQLVGAAWFAELGLRGLDDGIEEGRDQAQPGFDEHWQQFPLSAAEQIRQQAERTTMTIVQEEVVDGTRRFVETTTVTEKR